ncbi:MAG: hypothetical protein B6I38_11060 [Anaerolineaceae bacterium 4572_5.1]|nr:MAG: hypothetical protein B6I38_11060 [Anaerolineaceae bacterium 4572_5.1]
MFKLPGLIDPHVHVREPGATHKEDWDTATAAALAGGFTTILAMPNTIPPIFDENTLDLGLASAKSKARCDYAQHLGAGSNNADWDAHPNLPPRAAGLKMYLDSTFGELRLDDMTLWGIKVTCEVTPHHLFLTMPPPSSPRKRGGIMVSPPRAGGTEGGEGSKFAHALLRKKM